jgi:RNA polymerase sigma-70 factor, ECF subfamily
VCVSEDVKLDCSKERIARTSSEGDAMNLTRYSHLKSEQKEKESLQIDLFSITNEEKERRGCADEKFLISLLKNKEPSGLTVLIRKYHEKLFAVANRICNNPADTEEVLQDVYMIALKKIPYFEERSTLSTWLYRITVNAALMKLRSQRFNKYSVSMDNLTSVQNTDEDNQNIDEEPKSPDRSLLTRELYNQIQDSVEDLPEIYQNVFFLRDIQGFSIKETSEILQTTPAAIKSRLHRSRFYLQEKLKSYLTEN